jgi:uncharacterized small protein (DUF1192 family)
LESERAEEIAQLKAQLKAREERPRDVDARICILEDEIEKRKELIDQDRWPHRIQQQQKKSNVIA